MKQALREELLVLEAACKGAQTHNGHQHLLDVVDKVVVCPATVDILLKAYASKAGSVYKKIIDLGIPDDVYAQEFYNKINESLKAHTGFNYQEISASVLIDKNHFSSTEELSEDLLSKGFSNINHNIAKAIFAIDVI